MARNSVDSCAFCACAVRVRIEPSFPCHADARKNQMKRWLTTITFAWLMLCCATQPGAQDFPARPLRIVTGGPGSNGDVASRIIAQAMTPLAGQQVIVDNRTSGVILGEVVAKAPPDGYTLLLTGSSFWLLP